jgi:hypothetical protein
MPGVPLVDYLITAVSGLFIVTGIPALSPACTLIYGPPAAILRIRTIGKKHSTAVYALVYEHGISNPDKCQN